jgi:hypothetical protein
MRDASADAGDWHAERGGTEPEADQLDAAAAQGFGGACAAQRKRDQEAGRHRQRGADPAAVRNSAGAFECFLDAEDASERDRAGEPEQDERQFAPAAAAMPAGCAVRIPGSANER